MFKSAAKGDQTGRARLRRTIRYKLILLVMTPLSVAVALITGVSTFSSGPSSPSSARRSRP
jgi:hypothetical protein